MNDDQTNDQTKPKKDATDEANKEVTNEENATQEETTEATAQETTEEKPEGKPEEAETPEDLFDLLGESGKEHKKKKPEPAKTGPTQQTATKPAPTVYPSGSTIVYAGHKIELEEEMTGDQIIDFLEDDFPELTKENTEFTHDEARRRIIPNRKALKKGSDGCAPAGYTRRNSSREPRTVADAAATDRSRSAAIIQVETEIVDGPVRPVRRVLTHDGVYEIRNTNLGSFIARVPSKLDIGLKEGAYLKVPKAPVSLLERAIRIFQLRPHTEVMLSIMYNRRDDKHHLVWPTQTATATSIIYDAVPETDYLTTFLEIHSHNTMDAFFSRIDDSSESRATGLYGVVGRVDFDHPAAVFRFSCGTHHRPLYAADLFEDPWTVLPDLISEIRSRKS